MKHKWVIDRIGQRQKEACDSFGPRILAGVWEELPKTIEAAIAVYQQPGRLDGSKVTFQKGKDELRVKQLSPFQAGVVITRDELRCSIVGLYDDGLRRQVVVAFRDFSLDKLEDLVEHLLDPVLFPELSARDELPRWECLRRTSRKKS